MSKIFKSHLDAWAHLGLNFTKQIEKLKKYRLNYQNVDMENYIKYIFLHSMFYVVHVDGEGLPDLKSIVHQEEKGKEQFPKNTPKMWFDRFIKEPMKDKKIKEQYIIVENKYEKNYAILNTGLLNDKGVEIFMVFAENKKGENKQPFYFQSFMKANDDFLKKIALPSKVNLLTDINHVIFNEQKLLKWDNIDSINWNEDHILHDNKERIVDELYKKGFIAIPVNDLIENGYGNVFVVEEITSKIGNHTLKKRIRKKQSLIIKPDGENFVISTVNDTSNITLSSVVKGILDQKVCETDSSDTELLYIIVKEEEIEEIIKSIPIYNLKNILFEAIGESCRISKTNYKYIIPYIYNDQRAFTLRRGFLLPLKFNDKIFLTAAVNYVTNEKYYIQTVLPLSDAKRNADIICITDENWLHETNKMK